jgi:hypothetical protein
LSINIALVQGGSISHCKWQILYLGKKIIIIKRLESYLTKLEEVFGYGINGEQNSLSCLFLLASDTTMSKTNKQIVWIFTIKRRTTKTKKEGKLSTSPDKTIRFVGYQFMLDLLLV